MIFESNSWAREKVSFVAVPGASLVSPREERTMTKMRSILAFALAPAIPLAGLGVGVLKAQDQPITRTELLRADLAGIDGKETVIYIADIKAGAAGGRHTHYGDEFVYVLEGVLKVEPDGKEPITLKQGESAHLSPDVVHAARNGSDSAPAKVLVFLVVEKGKPLAEPVK
jgi:quercetin dioxygenase-like cupin family protein